MGSDGQESKFARLLRRAKQIYEVTSEVGAEVATTVFFDRRMSSPEKYFASWDSLLYLNRDDFPALANRVDYRIPSGNNTLIGHFYPNPSSKALILYVHGINSYSDDVNAAIQNYFVERGYAVMALDLTASGYSTGDCIDGLHQSAYDVAAAVEYIQKRIEFSRYSLCLMGHSWGAFGVTAANQFVSGVSAVVEFSGFYKPDVVMVSLAHGKAGYIADLSKDKLDAANERRSGSINPYISAVDGINAHLDVHYFLIHGDHDEIINIKRASILSQKRDFRNRHVVMKVLSRKHSDIFFSDAAVKSYEEGEKLVKEMLKPYKKPANVPPQILSQFQAKVSRQANSELNIPLFQEIERFLQKAIQ